MNGPREQFKHWNPSMPPLKVCPYCEEGLPTDNEEAVEHLIDCMQAEEEKGGSL